MKLLTYTTPLFGVLIYCLSFPLNASEEMGSASKNAWLMAKYDTNGDSMISVDEVAEKRNKMFAYMDADQDGAVTFNEYQTLDVRKRQVLLQARYKKLDQDHDGYVSAEEYASYLGSFDHFDFDGDGYITIEDMHSAKKLPQTASAEQDDTTRCLLWFCVRTTLD